MLELAVKNHDEPTAEASDALAAGAFETHCRLVAETLATSIAAECRLLLCGDRAASAAVRPFFAEHVIVETPRSGECDTAFLDRVLGADRFDAVDTVLFNGPDLSADAARETARDLRAIMDRCFHEARLVLSVGKAGGALEPCHDGADLVLHT